MTIGAIPPNLTFAMASTRDILPHFTVQPRLYNDAGFVPHPLAGSLFPQGPTALPARVPVAGVTGNAPGMPAWNAGHPHTINGREPGTNY